MQRMTKEQEEQATEELLAILAQYPEGLSTKDLVGTPKFHGMRTLTNSQVIRLLRASGKVGERIGGAGKRTFLCWSLKR